MAVAGSCCSFYAMSDVAYTIDLSNPEHQLANVQVQFPAVESEQLVVNLPIWRTGKYKVLPVADGIRTFNAVDSNGKPLGWQRTASGEWTIDVPQASTVNISYQVYADELGQRLRHIDDSHAYIDASGMLMYSPDYREQPIAVQLNVPQGWQSYSGMEQGDTPHSFIADNYDILIDSPIETGVSHHRQFSADGREYELVVWGEGNYNLEQIVTDLTKLSHTADVIWDNYPFERYVYMVHATSGERGATEHLNSTIIQLPRFNFRERTDYLRFISTASHEFIHTWNVKAYRPQGLVPYDYQNESLTQLLWLAEGSTSYFQNQLLLRADIMQPKEFFADLAKRIERNENNPGRLQQSVAEASATAWIAQGGDYAINHSVNIYSEGYLMSLALDFDLLNKTDLAHSYRDVHRQLYQQYALPKGYTVSDVQQILQQLTDESYIDWWQQHINQPIALDFVSLLNMAGLQLSYGDKVEPDTGIQLNSNSLQIAHVKRDSPAWIAGIHADDEIIAINGLKVTAAGFNKRINDFKAGDTIEITAFDNQQMKQFKLTLTDKPKDKLKIIAVKNPSRSQKAFLKAWLGIDWPFDKQGKWKSEK